MAGSQVTLREGDVLIVTDMQNDFLPGGALAVPQGGSIIGALNDAVDAFVSAGLTVIMAASRGSEFSSAATWTSIRSGTSCPPAPL